MEFMLAGATAIQIGTANFIDPAITVKVSEGINDYLERHGYTSVKRYNRCFGSLKNFIF